MQTFAWYLLKGLLHRRPRIIGRDVELRQHITARDAIGKQRTGIFANLVARNGDLLKSLCA